MVAAVIAAPGKRLNSPRAGVLCDAYMCADASGVSKARTQKFLGAAPATELFSQGAFDTGQFTFANGVFWDTKGRVRDTDRYFDGSGKRNPIDPVTMAILFGR